MNRVRIQILIIAPLIFLVSCNPPATQTPTDDKTATQPQRTATRPVSPSSPTSTKEPLTIPVSDVCVDANAMNVRAGPGQDYSIIGSVLKSECFAVDSRDASGAWVRISSGSWKMGVHGWVAARYLRTEDALDDLPLGEPDPTPTATRYRPSPTITRWPTATEGPTKPPPIGGPNGTNGSNNCDPCYPGVCIPKVNYDLDCKDVNYCRFKVTCDPHGFDGDNDGFGCERCN
jgi:hypothetical protein